MTDILQPSCATQLAETKQERAAASHHQARDDTETRANANAVGHLGTAAEHRESPARSEVSQANNGIAHSQEQSNQSQDEFDHLRIKLHLRGLKTGCRTCRIRKKKCDEGQPHCYNCWRRSLVCVPYE
ncbi:uncharacterized protein MYCFIDRAFT_212713 [Pseudocercospora fijiensis CIRAD86]|uniref:Zn(2)-C6 fungal-type domain-containing protein n=1 Tax=Pseudocercospora fijiensis (strain CIRAD86) TaxID=383855 RepID=M2ZY93_PSEFD|nr:uncharacterized protein MYCFIDRAFT_212713 [Pseudocercospora fijiensis CIRAD86]EME77086.1 hypothetical protein MYCFIDRAFT_212713 [Pseudocercospora fijiensis CIRAD86]